MSKVVDYPREQQRAALLARCAEQRATVRGIRAAMGLLPRSRGAALGMRGAIRLLRVIARLAKAA
jgi:hypothetical protein